MVPIILLDCGDTLVDEGSQVFDAAGNVLSATLLPGVDETLTALLAVGCCFCLVADGRVRSFTNILAGCGLDRYFTRRVISEAIGAEKPSAAMFEAAMASMALDVADRSRVVMVGNNLARDVLGANRFGIHSVWFDWSPRYSHVITSAEMRPEATIKQFAALPQAIAQLTQ